MRYGLQMFGLNPIFLKDKEAFLRRITSAGYRYMEPCLAMEEIPGLEDRVWTLAQLEENAALLNKYGVKINSCHLFTLDRHLCDHRSHNSDSDPPRVRTNQVRDQGRRQHYCLYVQQYRPCGRN